MVYQGAEIDNRGRFNHRNFQRREYARRKAFLGSLRGVDPREISDLEELAQQAMDQSTDPFNGTQNYDLEPQKQRYR